MRFDRERDRFPEMFLFCFGGDFLTEIFEESAFPFPLSYFVGAFLGTSFFGGDFIGAF